MKHGPPSLARLVAWSALLLALSLGGAACREQPPPPPAARELPDAERSSVEVNPALGSRANGQDTVEIRVTVRKADGTPLEGRAVTVEASGEGNTLRQPSGSTDAQGVAVATLASTVAGTKTVTATVEAEGGPVTLSSRPTVEFVSLSAPHLVFTGTPSFGIAGEPLGVFEVTIQDASGQTVTDASDTVTVALGEGSPAAALKGTLSVAAVNGVARFSTLVLDKAATGYTLVASAAGLGSATSPSFDILAAARKLVFTQQPSKRGTGETFEVRVAVTDEFGNRLSVSAPRVTLALNKGTLAGTTSVDPVDGVASFSDLSIAEAGTGYVLTASAEGLDSASSDPFDIVQLGPPARLVFRTQPTSVRVREVMPAVSVAITDASGNVLSVNSPDVTLGLVGGNNAAELLGTVTVKPVAGIATFSTLSVDQQGTDFWLVAMAGSLDSATSGKFTIVDDVAPSAVSLSVTERTFNQVTLAWTAVGDDGTLGYSSSYELRYSLEPITEASFGSTTPVSVSAPQAPGSAESARITGLTQATRYYFALKVKDDAGNSSLSFVDTTTPVDVCAGVTCTPDAPLCAADGVSRITYTAACVDVNGTATCQQTGTPTACTGNNAVCFNAQCDTAARPTANQLLVSEVMHSPSSGTTEYFELTNATDGLLNLSGLSVTYKNSSEAARSFLVDSGGAPLVVGRKGRFVLAQNKDRATNGGVSASYQYPSAIALEGSGSFIVANGASTVTEFRYTPSFPQNTGASMNLSSLILGTRASTLPWYWCASTDALTGGNFGTPEAANTACGMTASPAVSLCYIQSPKTIPPTQAGTAVTVYGRFKAASVTDRNTAGNDGYPYVVAELGYGPDTSPATAWTWTPSQANGEYAPTVSDEDETFGTLSISTPGSYKYGFRYSFKDPVTGAQSAYVYCGQSDISDPTNGVFGTVTITAPPAPLTDHVVISEFAPAGPTNASDEFIELYNPTNEEVDLAGWKLQYKRFDNRTSYTNEYELPAGAKIAAHGFYLVTSTAYAGSVKGDSSFGSFIALGATASGGNLRLGKPGISTAFGDALTVDRVGYGTAAFDTEGSPTGTIPSAAGSFERKAYSSSDIASMETGADVTHGNSYDSNNNKDDFVIRTTRNPQNRASGVELP